MKIALIIPKNGSKKEKSFYDIKFVSTFILSRKYFSYLLAIPTLATLTPSEHEVKVFDENIEDIDYNWEADLAGISVRTMFANRAYEISANFRKRGVKTVLGGIHPSFCTEEASEHADSVVVGEAEGIWAGLLKDHEAGKLQKIYRAAGKTDLKSAPLTRRENISKSKYFADIVQTSKGCPFVCEFCSVYSFDGQKIRSKPLEIVLKEIKETQKRHGKIKKKSVFFADDNIIANKKYAIELFKALQPLKINWSCQASVNISKEKEILKLMKESGCGSILVGFESTSQKNISQMDKKINLGFEYLDAIKEIHSQGILVHGSFILGNDFDELPAFDDLISFIDKSNLLMPLINILTPFPGTKLFKRLDDEGRIHHKDWSKYDAKTVVYTPALMTPVELMNGYKKVLQEIYSFKNIYKRLDTYWEIDFWEHSNEIDPIRFKYRLLFAIRLCCYFSLTDMEKTKFILKILPKLFDRKVRLSTILTMMSYNDFAYSL